METGVILGLGYLDKIIIPLLRGVGETLKKEHLFYMAKKFLGLKHHWLTY